jgi:ElaB/YqjD/DUF883 family membrane-anchored ribosome-binding protein
MATDPRLTPDPRSASSVAGPVGTAATPAGLGTTAADPSEAAIASSAIDPSDRSPDQIEREIELTRRQMSETIDAIQRKLTPNELVGQAFEYVRGGGSEFANNLGKAALANPVPVALIGIGLAWLALGGGKPAYLRRAGSARGRDPRARPTDVEWDRSVDEGDLGSSGAYSRVYEGSRSVHDAGGQRREGWRIGRRLGAWASGAAHAASSAARMASNATHMASSATERISDMASNTGRRVSSTTSGTGERVREMADDVRNLAAEWTESASSMASSTVATGREQAHRLGDTVRHQAAQVGNTAQYLMREQPLVIGAIGLAVGAVLGAVLPSTRREDELLGETRDRLIDQAAEAGQEAMQQAGAVAQKAASAAAETAREEAERRGLAPEASAGRTGEQGKSGSSGGGTGTGGDAGRPGEPSGPGRRGI